MTQSPNRTLLVGVSALTLTLAACGGGGGGSAPDQPVVTPPPPPPPATSEVDVTVQGPIQGFGSVIVNGVRYNTDDATVVIDGETKSLDDLSVGQIVALRATRKDGDDLPTALRVRYEEALEGIVDAVSADGSEIEILGITIIVTEDTIFEDDLDPATIAVGDRLEVSGSFAREDQLVASYIEEGDNEDSDYEIHGTVGALDTDAQTFRVRGVKVSYANATLEDFEDGKELANGDKVEVEGSTFTNDGTLIAAVVEYEGDDFEEFEGEDGDEAEIEGFVNGFVSDTEFFVGDIAVTTNADTEYERGTSADLADGVRIEVEGEFNADGILVADEIEFELEANIRVTAEVDAVDLDAGTLTVLGLVFTEDARTKYQDKGRDRVRQFGLDDIVVGDYVSVRAYELTDGTLLLKRVERDNEDADEGVELRGFVDENSETAFIVQGVEILTDEETEYEYASEDTTADTFFERVMVGDQVKIEGVETEDGLVLASEIDALVSEDEGDDD